jgi:hypothetical protein
MKSYRRVYEDLQSDEKDDTLKNYQNHEPYDQHTRAPEIWRPKTWEIFSNVDVQGLETHAFLRIRFDWRFQAIFANLRNDLNEISLITNVWDTHRLFNI